MSKWVVIFQVYASTRVEVDAETADEAVTVATKKTHVSICHQCSRHLEVGDLGEILEIERVEPEGVK
jgi:hypothetical protein